MSTTTKAKASGGKSAKTKATKRKAPASKSKSRSAAAGKYTKPELREKIKKKITDSDKGGRPGEWSARKAQLVAHEYKAEGGGYKEGGKTEAQQHLSQWTKEKWRTQNGQKAIKGKTTHRYLPEHVWEQLSPAERKATNARKVRGSRKGRQFVPNTSKARKTRKAVSASVARSGNNVGKKKATGKG